MCIGIYVSNTTTATKYKYCQSERVVKDGKVHGQQVFQCKDCSHKFYDNGRLSRMKVKKHVVVAALSLYYDGLSVKKTQLQLQQLLGEKVDSSTIYRWLQKYSKLTAAYVAKLQPELSCKWHEDETVIRCEGGNTWFWEVIDEETRFLVASHLSGERSIEQTIKIFENANRIAKTRPKAIFVDGSNSYDRAFNKVYYSRYAAKRVELVKRVGIQARQTNNIVERLHGTLKDRLRPMRGLKNDEAAKVLLDGYVVNYNYIRKHQAIKMTPAQAAGIQITNGWSELIDRATKDHALEHVNEKKPANSSEGQVIEVKQ
jgi:transposase-like protein